MASHSTSTARKNRQGENDDAGDDAAQGPGLRDEVRAMASDAAEHGRNIVGAAKNAAAGTVTDVRDAVKERADDYAQQARDMITASPIKAVAIAAGVGALVGGYILFGRRR
jgi:ElaB/YqjD/DUF883 family membrane-anchored ribosome-binding protein